MKKETLEDLSRITGYSKTTISLVLNGKGKEFRINDETCQQIIQAAKELNYRPNLVAQFLRKSEGRTLGIAVPFLSNPFFAQLVSTITIEAKKNNYSVMLFDTQEDANIEKKCISAMVEYEVNGIIIAPCSETPDLLEIISKNIPVILIDRYFRDSFLPYVSTNNYKGAYDAMMTLLNAGHRDILCIRGPETAVTTQERVKGCRKAVIDFGQPVRLQMLGNEFSIQNGYTETKVALIGPRVPTAIFAMSTNIL
ncbi:MAG: LacI family DNA-binding transcriptional regulator, partial [Prevotella sp.]|nr:LacI family DNA-binding transcriptional regulator [Prevotella sp.]